MKEGFKLPEDGLYSGFNAASGSYDKTTWNYEEGGDFSGKTDAATLRTRLPRLRTRRLPHLRLHYPRMSPTTSRFSIRAASFS